MVGLEFVGFLTGELASNHDGPSLSPLSASSLLDMDGDGDVRDAAAAVVLSFFVAAGGSSIVIHGRASD